MTITERAQKVLAEIDAALALAEKTTPGAWQVTGCDRHTDKATAYIKVRGTQPGAKWQIADVRFIEAENFTEQKEAQQIANFIAASRTGWPTSLRCLKTAIHALLYARDLAYSTSIAHDVIERDLTTLLDQWEAR